MNKLSVLLVMVLTALIAGNAWAKRVAPKPVTPVVHSGVQYAAPNEDGIEGQIEARNPKTGEKLWDVVIYKNKVKPNLEEDIQWVFITELAIRGDTLRVTNERGEIFTLDLTTRKVLAADPQIRRDVAYAEPKNERQMLDVYSPAEGKNHPVVVWIHGGGWRAGSKAGMQNKPQTFVDKGFVFVSTTYRFLPNVTVKQMTGDIAKAIRWVHEHAKEFGGDPDTIFVMGHSAGAHLAALVCTDDSYLKAEGLSLSIIRGCVPVDVSVYDIPKRLKDGGSVSPAALTAIFGETEELQRDLSPAAHVAKGKHIPPFLILYVADRADTKAQSQWLAEKLHAAGVAATVVAAEGKTHGTINSDLGLAGDKPTQAVFDFLDGVLPLQCEALTVEGRRAFIIAAKNAETGKPTPWVWYAPTLPGLPGNAERWMFDRFTAHGNAIAGIDVGESSGSPDGRKLYSAFYREMTEKRGFAAKPVMMGRSRGGLMALCWAVENPERVGGFAGCTESAPPCNPPPLTAIVEPTAIIRRH